MNNEDKILELEQRVEKLEKELEELRKIIEQRNEQEKKSKLNFNSKKFKIGTKIAIIPKKIYDKLKNKYDVAKKKINEISEKIFKDKNEKLFESGMRLAENQIKEEEIRKNNMDDAEILQEEENERRREEKNSDIKAAFREADKQKLLSFGKKAKQKITSAGSKIGVLPKLAYSSLVLGFDSLKEKALKKANELSSNYAESRDEKLFESGMRLAENQIKEEEEIRKNNMYDAEILQEEENEIRREEKISDIKAAFREADKQKLLNFGKEAKQKITSAGSKIGVLPKLAYSSLVLKKDKVFEKSLNVVNDITKTISDYKEEKENEKIQKAEEKAYIKDQKMAEKL